MKGIYRTTMAAAIAIALGGAAQAQQQSEPRSDVSQGSERDPFGGNQDQFGRDRDQFGQQSYESYQSSEHGRSASEEMSRLDANADQRIDESEAASDPELIAAWAEVDVSQDGSVDATEYYLYKAQSRIAELEQGSAGQPGAGSQPSGAANFDQADTDGDGSLSRSEYQAAMTGSDAGRSIPGESDFGQPDEDEEGVLN